MTPLLATSEAKTVPLPCSVPCGWINSVPTETRPPLVTFNVPVPAPPTDTWLLVVLASQDEPVPVTVTVPTYPALEPMLPAPLITAPPDEIVSEPRLTSSAPVVHLEPLPVTVTIPEDVASAKSPISAEFVPLETLPPEEIVR